MYSNEALKIAVNKIQFLSSMILESNENCGYKI